jgi:CheY-like chemotaxis protein
VPPTILVVDDDLVLAQSTARMLEQMGYETLAVSSPFSALAVLAGPNPVDLMITDVRMRELSGFDLASVARGERQTLPVLFISGFVEPDYGGQGGFQDFLAKPFSREQLSAAVDHLLGTARQG